MLGVAIVVDGGDNDVIALAVDGQLLGRRQGGRGYFINLIEIFMNASFCFRRGLPGIAGSLFIFS